MDFRPKMIIAGGSAYPREWDYTRFKAIADKCGALLMMDMAHISGASLLHAFMHHAACVFSCAVLSCVVNTCIQGWLLLGRLRRRSRSATS